QMLNHGVSTGALFIFVGMVYDRRHTRLIAEYGGLVKVMPVYSTLFFIITLSSIPFPLLNFFVGGVFFFVGGFSFKVLPYTTTFTAFAALGMILSAVYMLWMYQRVIYGNITNKANETLSDINGRERLALAPLIVLAFVMGVYPSLFLNRSSEAIVAI